MEQMGAFLPLILIFGVFYLLLIRPQQKKVKLHREMINNLKRGNKIITSGGIVGTITKVNDNKELLVQISENVEIKIAPGMVTDLYQAPEVVKNIDTSSNTKNFENKGKTIIPTKLYFKGGKVKIQIALAKGKKNWDKRESKKQKDIDREIKTSMKGM